MRTQSIPAVRADSEQTKSRLQARRRNVNRLALTLSLAAMGFGLVWLAWILWTTLTLGIGGLSLSLFTEMTPPANTPGGGLANAIAGSFLLVGLATLIGSLIPLIPFIFVPLFGLSVGVATLLAVPLCAAVLFGVGAYKAVTLVGDWRISGIQMLLIGMVSAAAGYLIGRLLHVGGA